jgi:hypothetical protein
VRFLKRFGFGLSIFIFGTVASSNAFAQCSSNTAAQNGELTAMNATCGSLQLGSTYNTFSIDENGFLAGSFGGGSILPSSLNGVPLAWVYCVGLFTDVGVPSTYDDTPVSSSAMVYGMLPGSTAVTGVNNAKAIAFLLGNFATAAIGNASAQEALQAAIWAEEYNGDSSVSSEPKVTGDPNAAYYAQYLTDLAVLNANPTAVANTSLSTIDWFSPSSNMGININQPLVGASLTFTPTGFAPTPEPASVLLFGTVILIAGRLAKQEYSRAGR